MNFMANESAQKLRGGYYTSDDLAQFLCKWVLETAPRLILEPSCGDGAFFSALRSAGADKNASVIGFELDPAEASKAGARARSAGIKATIHATDFLAWALDNHISGAQTFDAVIGNPPFIRYQYLPALFQARAEQVFRDLDLPFTKHTNAWVPFVLASMQMLRPGGRLAMVLPAEIIHVMHAQSLRSYLGKECRRIVIVDPTELWFSGTLQGAVLLLAEKRLTQNERVEGLGIYRATSREFLRLNPERIFSIPKSINGKTIAGKWTPALLSKSERDLLDEIVNFGNVHRFGNIARVDVGIVTGANKFFLVTNDIVESNGLEPWAHPMFGRSEHCPGIVYDARQHKANARAKLPTNFIWFRGAKPRTRKAQAYIAVGESAKLHARYKCRIRDPWYVVPSVYSTDIGMLKRSHDHPRLIWNKLRAYTTDTSYRIQAAKGIAVGSLVGNFINALTALSAELEGRHYGGGVLELVPSEIEKLIVPLPGTKVDISTLDKEVRRSSTEALELNTRRVLGNVPLSTAKQDSLLEAWKRLRDRRHRIPNGDQSDVPDVA